MFSLSWQWPARQDTQHSYNPPLKLDDLRTEGGELELAGVAIRCYREGVGFTYLPEHHLGGRFRIRWMPKNSFQYKYAEGATPVAAWNIYLKEREEDEQKVLRPTGS
jgi:hypothetical protein